jgi:hypothetical protein
MKKLKAFLTAIGTFALVYLISAYMAADFDILNWHPLVRGASGIIGAGLFAIVFSHIIWENK